MNNKLFALVGFVVHLVGFSQERQLVQGKLQSGAMGVSDALVVNFNAQKETRTDSLGNFTLPAKMGDLLIASDYKIETKKIRYTSDLVTNGVVLVEVKQAAAELEEVVINKYNFDAYEMGLTKTRVILPTVAERRLNSSGGSPLGLLISIINGQHKMLKKAVEIEKRETALAKLEEIIEPIFYTQDLKLLPEQSGGFKYYIVENDRFREMLLTADTGTLKFEMAELATEYKKLQADEK